MLVKNLLLDQVYRMNQKNIEDLQKIIHNEKWTLCLGAGVSKSAGLPNWVELLAKMMARLMFAQIGDECSNPAKKDSAVPEHLQSGGEKKEEQILVYGKAKRRYVESMESQAWMDCKKNMFESLDGRNKSVFEGQNTLELAEAMYQFMLNEVEFVNQGSRSFADYSIRELVKEACIPKKQIEQLKKETIGEIASLLVNADNDPCRHVITYNYDNILEYCLRELEKVDEKKVISGFDSNMKLPKEKEETYIIYHVHGCIPVEMKNAKNCEEESEKIVLTENSYYEAEKMNYSWSNVIQTQRMASSSMIFIGFSGQDYNFRRILKNLEPNNNYEHYILFCIDDFVNKIFSDKSFLSDAKMLRKKCGHELLLLNQVLNMQCSYWIQYGLIPIWTTADEISTLISDLKK